MIVREQDKSYIFITQHDHAQLSGWFAAFWGNDVVPVLPRPRAALQLAALMHDVGWVPLDQQPRWNESEGRPHSFATLPASIRVTYYRQGVDLVQRIDPYAALLCSLHYTSFFPSPSAVTDAAVREFLEDEYRRQKMLALELQHLRRHTELARTQHDLALVKLWDSISLYVALNEPGISKEEEHPWYRNGFSPVVTGSGASLHLQARWLDRERILLDPFPLKEPSAYPLPIRVVSKEDVAKEGLVSAYNNAEVQIQVVRFVAADNSRPETS